jgi:DNA-binding MarR family transcriptional regulator
MQLPKIVFACKVACFYQKSIQNSPKIIKKHLLCLHSMCSFLIFDQIQHKHMKHQETIDYYLKVTWQTIANKYNQIASEFEITQAVGYLLININEEDGTTVSEVASLLGLKSTSLSRTLNNLEEDGLIYREGHKEDKRSVKVYLTEKGKEKRHLARVVVRKFNDYLNENLEDKEREILVEALKKINSLTIDYKPD